MKKNYNYYNEIDKYCIEWLKNLIKKGLIPDGQIDERSIVDVQPDDLRGFTQCHFFSGIGGFSLALKLAGWPEDREIWTGSAPCQPFSVAGKGKGKSDERHLWPHLYRLISACRPAYAIGEQVGGAAGLNWLDGVFDDLESQDYSCQAFNLSACSVNAPHIRERLYWVGKNMGVTNSAGWYERQSTTKGMGYGYTSITGSGNSTFNMDNTQSEGLEGRIDNSSQSNTEARDSNIGPASSNSYDMADPNNIGCSRQEGPTSQQGSDRQDDRISFRGDISTYNDMADTVRTEWGQEAQEWHVNDGHNAGWQEAASGHQLHSSTNDMANAQGEQLRGGHAGEPVSPSSSNEGEAQQRERLWPDVGADGINFWDNAIWLNGADGKTRRAPGISQPKLCSVDDGFSPGVDGLRPSIPLLTTQAEARAAKLKGLGNAIVPQLAAEFIKAIMETFK
jgi:DNA (cytosine-5)-methyltransferase 1